MPPTQYIISGKVAPPPNSRDALFSLLQGADPLDPKAPQGSLGGQGNPAGPKGTQGNPKGPKGTQGRPKETQGAQNLNLLSKMEGYRKNIKFLK